ncbi:MAG: hypothetical protein AVDCRST_MAG18-2521 [uncultured Thermomicrobiales bacterium]|uniref:Uncharacterized protein n=1 Tax=uncultured Thermomicrobiales bacterium TaxID=1645740 RepID=A0A6J4VDE4_9BACT|nr:MAG: hypothetical protein AVDCRST_MAG18-2521 [uncultured Thermomicrobiales bacterium]
MIAAWVARAAGPRSGRLSPAAVLAIVPLARCPERLGCLSDQDVTPAS